jgi:hypothetical protein
MYLYIITMRKTRGHCRLSFFLKEAKQPLCYCKVAYTFLYNKKAPIHILDLL